ncbi:hypothetical protein QR680_009274 [Steinernema hermaphroditum]|uniref:ATP-dependent DNA helicase n=1 Tax=Steinernema hermaphroditum TaxID=289476 RepID=A0AA39IJP5_9BILA|nr:hypothetical protein QR680_009274 [Steinernema hermaphroditum]
MNSRADGIVVDYDEAEHVDLFRTLSAHEAYLRIMGVQIIYTSHFVDVLPVHAEGNRFVIYRQNADDQEIVDQLLKESKLEAFFAFWKENYCKPKRCREKPMTYPEFAECHRENAETPRHCPRTSCSSPQAGTLRHAGPPHYHQRPQVVRRSSRQQGYLRGEGDRTWPYRLKFWDNYLPEMVQFAKRPKDIRAAFARLKIGIRDLERHLRRFGCSLVEFGEDEVDRFFRESDSLYPELEGRNGDIDYDGIREQEDQDFEILNDDQKNIVRTIEEAVQYRHLHNQQRPFELNGSGGTGKTLTINTLIRRLIGRGKKIIVCASTGIAATLFVSGKTVRSAFKVAPNRPVPQYSAHTEQGKKVMEAEVIIWDETTMSNRILINAIDQHCCDVLPNIYDHKETTFGGKVVLVCGDWKQLLPVVEGAAAPIEQLRASFKYTNSVDKFKTLKLTRNMRIGHDEVSYRHYTERVGNGYYMLDRTLAAKKQRFIPPHKDSHQVFSSGDLLTAVFPEDLLFDKDRYEELGTRAVLAAHNENVDKINAEALRKVPGESTVYEAIDEPAVDCPFTVPLLGPESFQHRAASGMPKHHLELKEGAMVMLCRNLDVEAGLCNGTKLIVTKLLQHGVMCKFVKRPPNGKKRIFISPLRFKHVDKCGPTFSFFRRQLPLRLCYAMSINKAQGQTFDRCGLLLTSPVFSHGQLYVALTRVRRAQDLTMCVTTDPLAEIKLFNVTCDSFVIALSSECSKCNVNNKSSPQKSPCSSI